MSKRWPRGQLQRVALIRAEEPPLLKLPRGAVLSTQACPQSFWEKAVAPQNTMITERGEETGKDVRDYVISLLTRRRRRTTQMTHCFQSS